MNVTAWELRASAADYAREGKHIIPCRPRTKDPATTHAYLDASCDPDQAEAWWAEEPAANIAYVPGRSGEIVIDFDPNSMTPEAHAISKRLDREAPTRSLSTPSGGWDRVYRLPDGQTVGNSKGALPPGIDVRAHGGYALLPPSVVTYTGDKARDKGVPDGFTGTYTVTDDREPAPIPDWLLDQILRGVHSPATGPANPRKVERGLRTALRVLERGQWAHAEPQEYNGGWKIVLSECPFAPHEDPHEDDTAAFVLVGPDGVLRAGCHHNRCQARLAEWNGNGWALLRRESGYDTPPAVVALTEPAWDDDVPTVHYYPDPDGPPVHVNGDGAHDGNAGTAIAQELPQVAAHVNGNGNGHAPRTVTFDLERYQAEDGGILDCWRDVAGHEWLFVTGYENWYRWTGTHWAKDDRQALALQVQDLADAMNKAARAAFLALPPKPKGRDAEDPDAGRRAFLAAMIQSTKRSQGRINSVAGMAQSRRAKPAPELDQGNLLNLRNGTLDLDSLTLRPHSPSDYLTFCLDYDYDPAASAPRWEQFVREVFVKEERDGRGEWATDDELVTLFQEAVGYSLTTDTRHETMFWMIGEANSGKSTILAVLRGLLGGLALDVKYRTLGEPGDYTIAKVPGKRVLLNSESKKGAGFNEDLVKKLVSGHSDVIEDARAIYGVPFDFHSVAKLWWMMNDFPAIRDTSGAIWRRLQLFPLRRTWDVQSRDVTLGETLRGELPGILNWALAGLQRLRGRGVFPEPQAATRAKEEYRHDANPVHQWLTERTITKTAGGDQLWSPASACHKDYCEWAAANQRKPMNNTSFGRELGKLAPRKRGEGGNEYGVGLLVHPGTPAAV